jgi:hypothetical protein
MKGFTFEMLSSHKINDMLVEFKHAKLGLQYPPLEQTPFSVAQNAYTQSINRGNISANDNVQSVPNTPLEDDEWLSKGNYEKTDEELSLMGITVTQETVQSYEDVLIYYPHHNNNNNK